MKKGFRFHNEKIVCKICNKSYVGYQGFGLHVRNSHLLDAKGYFDLTGDKTLGAYLVCDTCGEPYFVGGKLGREPRGERHTCGKKECYNEWKKRDMKRLSDEGRNDKFEAWSKGWRCPYDLYARFHNNAQWTCV